MAALGLWSGTAASHERVIEGFIGRRRAVPTKRRNFSAGGGHRMFHEPMSAAQVVN
jgi:hypothetical protein